MNFYSTFVPLFSNVIQTSGLQHIALFDGLHQVSSLRVTTEQVFTHFGLFSAAGRKPRFVPTDGGKVLNNRTDFRFETVRRFLISSRISLGLGGFPHRCLRCRQPPRKGWMKRCDNQPRTLIRSSGSN